MSSSIDIQQTSVLIVTTELDVEEGNIIPPADEGTETSSEWLGDKTPALILDGEGMQEFASNLLLQEEESIEQTPAEFTNEPEGDVDEVDDEGMVGARTFSDVGEDEEWVLERIVKRRLNKETKEHEYLCKWKWYAEHTWEEKQWLLDQGHGKEVQAVDDARMPAKPTLRYTTRTREVALPPLTKRMLVHFPNFIHDVCQQFRRVNQRVTQFAECPPSSVATKRFMETWAKEPHSKPLILFHGTDFANVPSIIERGLKFPAFRSSIATFTTPSFGHSRDNDKLFVCLGLPTKDMTGSYGCYIFSDESRVMPLWVVEHVLCYWHPESVDRVPHDPQPVPISTILNCKVRKNPPTNGYTPAVLPTEKIINASPLHPQSLMDVPTGTFRNGGMSKKMLKQQPRWIKDLYKGGQIPPKHK